MALSTYVVSRLALLCGDFAGQVVVDDTNDRWKLESGLTCGWEGLLCIGLALLYCSHALAAHAVAVWQQLLERGLPLYDLGGNFAGAHKHISNNHVTTAVHIKPKQSI